MHRARRQVGFHADDWFDSLRLRRFVKVNHPEHRAVVGDRHGGHIQFLHALDQLLDIREAVEQGVFRVNVEVGETHRSLLVG